MTFELHTLKKRADFVRARNGRHFATPGLILQAVYTPPLQLAAATGAGETENAAEADMSPAPRFGFTATKKLGNAVVRNRIKRRLREAVRQIAPRLARPGFEYVLIGRQTTLKRPFSLLLDDLARAFEKVHTPQSGRGKGPASASGPRRRHRSPERSRELGRK